MLNLYTGTAHTRLGHFIQLRTQTLLGTYKVVFRRDFSNLVEFSSSFRRDLRNLVELSSRIEQSHRAFVTMICNST